MLTSFSCGVAFKAVKTAWRGDLCCGLRPVSQAPLVRYVNKLTLILMICKLFRLEHAAKYRGGSLLSFEYWAAWFNFIRPPQICWGVVPREKDHCSPETDLVILFLIDFTRKFLYHSRGFNTQFSGPTLGSLSPVRPMILWVNWTLFNLKKNHGGVF